MVCCTVCGLWSPALGPDRLDICEDCWNQNFAGNILESPTARQALDAYVCSAQPLTPRQRETMARMTEQWHRQAHTED